MLNQSQIYPVDIVLCIDGTGSMRKIINDAKAQAIRFHDDFVRAMEKMEKQPGKLRVRLIVFRDIKFKQFAETTRFFNLPDERDEFAAEVSKIKAKGGGGDGPESALEALIEAAKSDWIKDQGLRQRHVIVLWTDAGAHTEALRDFTAAWSEMQFNYKRLVVYAPERKPWPELSENLDNSVFYFSKAGQGLADVDYESIMNAIAASV